MRTKLLFTLFLISSFVSAQIEMTPKGFAPVEFPTPNRPLEDLMQVAKGWAYSYNKKGVDIHDVTSNSMTIDALRENAYYYINRGESYYFDVKYSLKVVFQNDNTCKITFTAMEFYDEGKLLKTTIADFFTPDGKLKEGFDQVKPSLESTVSKIMNSFSSRFQN